VALNPVRNGPDPDIYVFWHSSAGTPPGLNFSGMAKNVFLDKDLEDGRYNADTKARRDAYADAQKLLSENKPAVFICSPDLLVGINNRVRGYRLYRAAESSGRLEFAQDWYVNTRRVGR
jgi:ABC-type transport system substrate-binding protein